MHEEFEIPVEFNGKEYMFKAKLLNIGYTYKILVEVNGVEVFFEPDEERNYRAIVDPAFLEGNNKLDAGLLQAISNTIESATK